MSVSRYVGFERQTEPLGRRRQEADIEIGIMRTQHAPTAEDQKFRQHLRNGRCIRHHGVRDAGKVDDLLRDGAAGVHERLERIDDLPVAQDNGADLRDLVVLSRKARGLKVEGDELAVQRQACRTVDGDAVVHVIDIIALAAIEDLDVLIRPRHLVLRGIQGSRERRGNAVVRDGNGAVAPAGSRGDGLARLCQGVHHGHCRVKVQLHALLRRGIHTDGRLRGLHGQRLEHDVVFKPAEADEALHTQPLAGLLDGVDEWLGLIGLHKAVHADGAGVVRHIEIHDPRIALLELLVVHGEHAALDDDAADVAVLRQLAHGRDVPVERLAIDRLRRCGRLRVLSALRLSRRSRGDRHIAQRGKAHFLRLGKQLLPTGSWFEITSMPMRTPKRSVRSRSAAGRCGVSWSRPLARR